MILEEIGNHVSPTQAIAAVWLAVGFFAGKAALIGAEWAWCSLTRRDIRPCRCRHCASVRLAVNLADERRGAAVIPFNPRKRAAA